MRLQQRRRLVERRLVVVVAVDDLDELHVRVIRRQQLLHLVDPGVLVRRVGRGGEHRDLTGVTDLLGDEVDLGLGDAVGGGLVDEQVTAVGVGVGVEGDNLHTRVAGLVERVADRLRVVRRGDEAPDALLRGGVDVAHLRVGRGLGRSDLGEGAAELVDGGLAALARRVEVGVAEVLGQERDREVLARSAARVAGGASAGASGVGASGKGELRVMMTIACPIATSTRIDGVSHRSRHPSGEKRNAGFLAVAAMMTSTRAMRMPNSRALPRAPMRRLMPETGMRVVEVKVMRNAPMTGARRRTAVRRASRRT